MARVLEGLSVLAGGSTAKFVPNTPNRLRAARTCYDHIAGTLGVALHDRILESGWLTESYEIGARPGCVTLGIDVDTPRGRRRFACPCLDWSERRPHLGGALGAALLTLAVQRKWVERDLDSRALSLTPIGRRELKHRLDLPL